LGAVECSEVVLDIGTVIMEQRGEAMKVSLPAQQDGVLIESGKLKTSSRFFQTRPLPRNTLAGRIRKRLDTGGDSS
jgi:hypothetical protein